MVLLEEGPEITCLFKGSHTIVYYKRLENVLGEEGRFHLRVLRNSSIKLIQRNELTLHVFWLLVFIYVTVKIVLSSSYCQGELREGHFI